jgi:hypothetical protein
MLTLYLDESFDETTGMYFVAGFAGSKSQWREYVPRWRAVLCLNPMLRLVRSGLMFIAICALRLF